VERQCQLAEVSRAGFYRYLQQTTPEQADLLLRARLQELAVAHHRLRGYRMLTALLRREGRVNLQGRARNSHDSADPWPGFGIFAFYFPSI
jgi:hypothetical protein